MTEAPSGYDFNADVEGTRSLAHTLEAGVRFGALRNALERQEETLRRLGSRIEALEGAGILVPASLQGSYTSQTEQLAEVGREARRLADEEEARLRPRVEALWAQIEQNDERIAESGFATNAASIAAALQASETLKAEMEDAEQRIHAAFSGTANETRVLEQKVTRLERATQLLDAARFSLQQDEALAMAARASYGHPGKAAEGVLYLSNRRLLFEQEEENGGRLAFLPFGRRRQGAALRVDLPLEQLGAVESEAGVNGERLVVAAGDRSHRFGLNDPVALWLEAIDQLRAPLSTS